MENLHSTSDSEKRSTDHDTDDERKGSRATDVAVPALLGGAAAGAVAGTFAGPIGAAVGAVIGAVAAGFAGNEIAASIDKTREEAHWRDNYSKRAYVGSDGTFEDYGPAYGHGVDGYIKHPGRSFDDAEPDLFRDWSSSRGTSTLDWERARPATRDAWDRLSDSVGRSEKNDSNRTGDL